MVNSECGNKQFQHPQVGVEHFPVRPRAWQLAWIAFFVAAGLLGFELSLMRVLLVASWHHFAFLVISIALLGFGASGTGLSLLRTRLVPHGRSVLYVLVLAAAASMPLCVGLAQHIDVESRITPVLLWHQIGQWIVYWGLLGVPFFMGAGAIGLALMLAADDIPRVYGANMVGSAAGLVLATAAMRVVPPEWLATGMGVLTLMGAAAMGPSSPDLQGRRRAYTRLGTGAACVALVAAYLAIDPPHVSLDPYKYGAFVQRLRRQGEAERVAVAYGPRGVVEAFSSGAFHDLPFLSVGATPPAMTALLVDGHSAGSVLEITAADEAEAMDRTLTAMAYSLAPPRPRVLLLGETGGTNVWLAERRQAAAIDVVQPDVNVRALLRGPLQQRGGQVLNLPNVRVIAAEPRHVVEHAAQPYDLIQLVTLEASAAGSGGMAGLAEDHLITVEGLTACMKRLSGDGLLVAARGIQTPPRDNVKLLATLVAALRNAGAAAPERHIVIVRDFLAVCTIAKASPWTDQQIELVRRTCTQRELTPVWFHGVNTEELNRPDAMPGPPGSRGDWYYDAAVQLFSSDADRFIRQWPFDIRPPTDDRPFFLDFCKLASIGELKRAFGDLWLTRIELAFLFVLAAIVVVGAAAALLTTLPLLLIRDVRRAAGLGSTVAYFAALGLGYLLLEMTFLSRMTHWIGDPINAAAVTIAAFLLSSGLGSFTAQRLGRKSGRTAACLIVALIVLGLVELAAVGKLAGPVGSLSDLTRRGLAFLTIVPLGYLMGFPMPTGLRQLERNAPSLVPWAWGVNGFASVLAAPVATAIGMTWGYTATGVVALALYLVPAVLLAKKGS